ncbi:hypothetical protein WAX78_18275 [Bacillus sp. FJAT-53711]|uniref:Uncharacterized protein n=1 Tax=Bacillus yunxiaonensis TaxID=3127665 RepID=A0ABU8FZF5_9BACI
MSYKQNRRPILWSSVCLLGVERALQDPVMLLASGHSVAIEEIRIKEL